MVRKSFYLVLLAFASESAGLPIIVRRDHGQVEDFSKGFEQDAPDLMDVYADNEKIRNSVKVWITPEILHTSLFNYGLGPPVEALAKETLGPIQHDFVSQLGARLSARGQQVNYLEIGVSVLKSIHTQSHFFHNGVIISFDIEDPNPIIEGLWEQKAQVDSWPVSSFRKKHGRTSDYINQYIGPNSNTLYYQAGDAFDPASYEHMKKTIVAQHGPVNLILSDGFHEGDAVSTELDNLISHGIIQPGEDFSMVWDDCHSNGHSNGIFEIVTQKNFPKLRSLFADKATCSGLFLIPGWVGKNEGSHPTCVFTTFDLSGPHLGASKTWIPPEQSTPLGEYEGMKVSCLPPASGR